MKKILKILQNSQENRLSPAFKKRLWEFCKILRTAFLIENFQWLLLGVPEIWYD